MADEDIRVEITSIYGAATKKGLVEFTINGKKLQMDVPKAREIVLMLHGAIEAATSDELLMQFMVNRLGLSEDKSGVALLDFRKLRQGTVGTVWQGLREHISDPPVGGSER